MQCEVKSIDKHRVLASFVPKFASDYLIDIKLNDESVSNCPFTYSVLSSNPEKTVFNIETIDNFQVNQTTSFDIQLNDVPFDKGDLSVSIVDSLGQHIANRIVQESPNLYRVYFTVPAVGNYNFKVLLKNTSLIHSFAAKAYDISKIVISDIANRISLGQKCCFQGTLFASLIG